MKKRLYLLPLAFSLLILSCTKNNDTKENNTAASTEQSFDLEAYESDNAAQVEYGTGNAVMLYDDGSLWSESVDGEMFFSGKTVPAGTKLNMLTNPDGTFIKKNATRNLSGNKTEREFAYLSYDDGRYWVQTNIIALDMIPAVVTDESFLYKAPKSISPYSPTVLLSFGDVIAVSEKEVTGDDGRIFYQAALKKGEKVYENVYVEEIFTTSEESFYVMDLVKNLNNTDNEIYIKELITIGSSVVSSGKVKSSIKDLFTQASIDALDRTKVAEVPVDYYVFDDYYVEAIPGEGENFNIRSTPSLKGDAYKTVSSGQEYEIIMMTKNAEEVNGKTGHWYYIRALDENGNFDVAGWVFNDRFNVFGRNLD